MQVAAALAYTAAARQRSDDLAAENAALRAALLKQGGAGALPPGGGGVADTMEEDGAAEEGVAHRVAHGAAEEGPRRAGPSAPAAAAAAAEKAAEGAETERPFGRAVSAFEAHSWLPSAAPSAPDGPAKLRTSEGARGERGRQLVLEEGGGAQRGARGGAREREVGAAVGA